MSKVRLLLADDHPLFLQGLIALLRAEKDLEISATASNGNEVLDLLQRQKIDICILDIGMPGLNGIETVKRIREMKIGTRVIMLTTYSDLEFIRAIVRLDVPGYVLKNATGTELVGAIRKVLAGQTYFSNEVHNSITNDFIQQEKLKQKTAVALTPREIEIIRLLAGELTNDEIAKKLFISFRTVETHRKNIMQKTGAKNLAGLIHFANANGLL